MSTVTQEVIDLCEQLPATKRLEVANFARFLLAQEGDDRWEQIISDDAPRPKLEAFLESSRREPAEPLDIRRL